MVQRISRKLGYDYYVSADQCHFSILQTMFYTLNTRLTWEAFFHSKIGTEIAGEMVTCDVFNALAHAYVALEETPLSPPM